MIELRNVTKSYAFESGERRFVFRDLSFTFPDRVNIGLIGGNGAGKSTLMRLLGGIDVPDRGRIVTDRTISWPIGLQGGFSGTLSGRDNVKFVCRIYGTSREEMRERVREVEEFAEIGDYFDLPVKSYSSGMRTRLAFGLSMAFPFDYYLIDEVMAVGDAEFKRKSKAALEERLKHSNLILVSHNMQDIAKLCDVVVLLKDHAAILYEDVKAGIRAYQGTGQQALNLGNSQQARPVGRGQVPAPGVERRQGPPGLQPGRPAAVAGTPLPGKGPRTPAVQRQPPIGVRPQQGTAPGVTSGQGGAGAAGPVRPAPTSLSPQGPRLGMGAGGPGTPAATNPRAPTPGGLGESGKRSGTVSASESKAPTKQPPKSADGSADRLTGEAAL